MPSITNPSLSPPTHIRLLPLTFCYCVTGDGEGGIEMTGSMQLIREFCDLFVTPEKVTRTRIVSLVHMSAIYIFPLHISFIGPIDLCTIV